ncbi:MAG TPA: Nif3-like dinuclear metal center hexameric protein [Candidatus Absconditabacterales bacterium]|nr:Nif3-like dinuclear metal center hexameric protein [Candidatus Absconditabacterales bacterium]
MKKVELINFLNEYLKIDEYEDSSKNGLQVDSQKTEIKKIGYAVDATSYIFDKAIKEKVDMIICHHGLFWGFDPVVVGTHYDRLSKLIKNDIALYACHLPLDGHEEVGNNVVMLNKFVDFFAMKDCKISQIDVGYEIFFENHIDLRKIKEFCENVDIEYKYFDNADKIKSVVFCSGSGRNFIEGRYGDYNLLITGELNHETLVLAKENNLSVLLGGHYETEIFGVQALAEKLKEKFGVEIVFLDEKY